MGTQPRLYLLNTCLWGWFCPTGAGEALGSGQLAPEHLSARQVPAQCKPTLTLLRPVIYTRCSTGFQSIPLSLWLTPIPVLEAAVQPRAEPGTAPGAEPCAGRAELHGETARAHSHITFRKAAHWELLTPSLLGSFHSFLPALLQWKPCPDLLKAVEDSHWSSNFEVFFFLIVNLYLN